MLDTLSIYFFGDSIAFGQGVTICDTWVCKTAQYLKDYYKQRGETKETIVNNMSINGNTTRMALERMPFDIQSKEIDILIVEFGMNDCNYWETDCGCSRVSPMAFEANLEEIIKRARIFHAKNVLLLTNHVSGKDSEAMPHTTITYQQNNEKYNEIIRRVASKNSGYVHLADMEKYFKEEINKSDMPEKLIKDYLLPDLIHLSSLGHEMYYRYFIPHLIEVLEGVECNK